MAAEGVLKTQGVPWGINTDSALIYTKNPAETLVT